MRKLGVILALFLFALCMGVPARAASGALLTGEDAKEIEAILPWVITNTQGDERNGKTAYIIGGMRLGACVAPPPGTPSTKARRLPKMCGSSGCSPLLRDSPSPGPALS